MRTSSVPRKNSSLAVSISPTPGNPLGGSPLKARGVPPNIRRGTCRIVNRPGDLWASLWNFVRNNEALGQKNGISGVSTGHERYMSHAHWSGRELGTDNLPGCSASPDSRSGCRYVICCYLERLKT